MKQKNKTHLRRLLALSTAMLLMAFSVCASTIYVGSSGSDAAGYGASSGNPYATITYAISQASAGDVIIVEAGTYTENININKGVTIQGPNAGVAGTATRGAEAQLLDCNIDVTTSGAVVLDGFYIHQTDNNPDVILLSSNSSATIENNVIARTGTAAGQVVRAITTGGGSSAATIQNNLFTGDPSGGVFGSHKTWNNAVYVNGGTGSINILNNTFAICRTALNLDDYGASINVSGNNFDNSGTFISFGGAAPTNGQFTLGANDFTTNVDALINLSNVTTAFRLNMSSSTLGGTSFSSLPLASLFNVEAHMYHRGYSGKNGLVYYVAGHEYVQGNTSIQSAVNYGASGDIITIKAGTYSERVTVSKPLTIQGENKTTTIVSGAALSGAGSGFFINNGVANVTIKDLTIQNFAGTSPNSFAGVYATGGNNNLTITNNIIKDNVGGAGIYANGPINNVLIDGNKVSGHTSAFGAARGIVIWNGLKQNITIINNEVFNNNCCGIELQDGTATGVTLTGNNIHDNADNGVGLIGLQGPGANWIASNTLVDNGRFGIEVKLPNGSGLSSGPGSIVINGNNISRTVAPTDARDLAGISVYRRGYVVGNNNVDVPVGTVVSNNTVSGYTHSSSSSEGFGIVVEGINHTVSGNTVSGNDVGIQRQAGHLPYTANTAVDGDQSDVADNYFGRGNSPVTCGVTESGNTFSSNGIDTRDVGNSAGTGVVVNTNTGMSYCSIQDALNAATAGDVLTASAGSYNENITISKAITLKGANYNAACDARGPESIINGTGTSAIIIGADDVIVKGFKVTNHSGSFGILINNKSNIDVEYNNVTDVGNSASGNSPSFGIYDQLSQSTGNNSSNVVLSNNCISDIRGGANTALTGSAAKSNNGSGSGIGVGDSHAGSDITGLAINGNTITNISANTSAFTDGGKGAYGIIINVGASTSGIGKASGAQITNNVISGLTGLWAHGVGLEGETPYASVLNNAMNGFTDYSNGDAAGVRVEDNDGASSVQIHENSFTNMAYGVANVTAPTVGATCNWYGSALSATVATKVAGNVTYIPYLVNGTDNSPAIGFQPAAGSCTGNGTAPTIHCPADITVTCPNQTSPTYTGTATANTNCGLTSITYTDVTTPVSNANNFTITRTWKATDACNNSSTCNQIITVDDNPGALASYTLLADKEVKLDDNNDVFNGSVGATASNGKVSVDKYGSVASPGAFVQAANITVNGLANVPITYTGAAPVSMPAAMLNMSSTAGLSNLTINSNGSVSGNYKDVTVNNGVSVTLSGTVFHNIKIKNGASVTFTTGSGAINIGSLDMDDNSTLSFSNDTKVLATGNVTIGKNCSVNATSNAVEFHVADPNNPNAGKNFTINDGGTSVNANIIMPSGLLDVKGGNVTTTMTGQFVADKIHSGKNVQWNGSNCSGSSSARMVNAQPAQAPGATKESNILVYPNPTTGEFTVRFEDVTKSATVRVLDIQGRVMEQRNVEPSQIPAANFNLSGKSAGVYLIEVLQDGQHNWSRLVVQ